MKRLVIVGAGGRLGAALAREYQGEFDAVGFNHAQLDLGKPEELRTTLGAIEFDALINTAAQTNVDRCETEREEAFALNAEAPRILAEICAGKSARFIHISTDYVFDGEKREPYTEEDEARPVSVYGESKREGERRALDANPESLVVRVSWVFGPDRPSFVDWAIGQAREKEEVKAIADKWATPTYTLDLAEWLKPLVVAGIDDPGPEESGESKTRAGITDPGYSDDPGREERGEGKTRAGISDPGYSSDLGREERGDGKRKAGISGILHLANSGECSWQEYAQWALECCRAQGMPMKARRIGGSSLGGVKSFIAERPGYNGVLPEKNFR